MFYDLTGAIFSFISTCLFIKEDNRAWGIGILATVLNAWLFFQSAIYADMSLEGFYFLSMCYGWHRWSKDSATELADPTIKSMTGKQWGLSIAAITIIYTITWQILIRYTDSTIAELDALTTALSLVAQWLMCHKIIATWIFWFITDSLYALIYYKKHLPYHMVLMVLYSGMAVIGYLSWQKRPLCSYSTNSTTL